MQISLLPQQHSAYGTDPLPMRLPARRRLPRRKALVRSRPARHRVPESLQANIPARAGGEQHPSARRPLRRRGHRGVQHPGANANAVKRDVVCGPHVGQPRHRRRHRLVPPQRRADEHRESCREGEEGTAGREVKGKKLGVIGLGAIGAEVANIAIDLGMDAGRVRSVRVGGRSMAYFDAVHHVTNSTTFSALCDYMTTTCRAMEGTIGMIDERACSLMKDGAVF